MSVDLRELAARVDRSGRKGQARQDEVPQESRTHRAAVPLVVALSLVMIAWLGDDAGSGGGGRPARAAAGGRRGPGSARRRGAYESDQNNFVAGSRNLRIQCKCRRGSSRSRRQGVC